MPVKFKPAGHAGLFDHEENKAKLSKLGNPLEKLGNAINPNISYDYMILKLNHCQITFPII